MRPAEDAEAHHLHIFLQGGFGDHIRRLAQAGVNDFHTGIAQSTSHHLGTPIMAVQARFSN